MSSGPCATARWRALGFERSYVTIVRQLRLLGLRPRCQACRNGGHGVTTTLVQEPGKEIRWDWLELTETPWASRRARRRAVVLGEAPGGDQQGITFAHLVEAIDGVLRRLGGTA
jgi:hypothetical protein